jgi:hypothetical protein
MRPSLTDAAFAFDGQVVTVGQVVLAAVVWGEWAQLECEARRGLLATERARREGASLGDDELRPTLIAWRRERQLLSAEDYQAWLALRGLNVEDMAGYLRRAIARRAVVEVVAGTPDHASDDDAESAGLAGVVYPEAILEGRLQAWAERMARQRAAVRALHARGTEVPPASAEAVEGVVAAAARVPASGLGGVPAEQLQGWAAALLEAASAWHVLEDLVAKDDSIEQCLSGHRLDWQRLEWEEADFAREDVAHEAALWVREEGAALAAVAERAGMPCAVKTAYGHEAGELAQLLAAARPGELLGPLAAHTGWRLLLLRERVLPSALDPQLRARALAELLDDALAPQLAGRIEWHARF